MNGAVQYSLSSGPAVFTVHGASGAVSVKGRLDRDVNPLHTVHVVATDAGIPPLSATATLIVSRMSHESHHCQPQQL